MLTLSDSVGGQGKSVTIATWYPGSIQVPRKSQVLAGKSLFDQATPYAYPFLSYQMIEVSDEYYTPGGTVSNGIYHHIQIASMELDMWINDFITVLSK